MNKNKVLFSIILMFYFFLYKSSLKTLSIFFKHIFLKYYFNFLYIPLQFLAVHIHLIWFQYNILDLFIFTQYLTRNQNKRRQDLDTTKKIIQIPHHHKRLFRVNKHKYNTPYNNNVTPIYFFNQFGSIHII